MKKNIVYIIAFFILLILPATCISLFFYDIKIIFYVIATALAIILFLFTLGLSSNLTKQRAIAYYSSLLVCIGIGILISSFKSVVDGLLLGVCCSYYISSAVLLFFLKKTVSQTEKTTDTSEQRKKIKKRTPPAPKHIERSEDTIKNEVFKYLRNCGVDLQSDDFSWYVDLCKVVDRYVHGKLPVSSIMLAQDKFSDLLTTGLPGFWAGPLPKNDRIKGQIRAMNVIPELKDAGLTYDEKEALAFCIYYNVCIKKFDEETGRMVSTIADFKSFDHIDAEYRHMKSNGLHDELFMRDTDEIKQGEFGYDKSNPICVISVPESYRYIKRLQPVEGIIEDYNRTGSLSSNCGILDEWVIKVNKNGIIQKHTIYINCYAVNSTTIAPNGFVLK